MEVHFLTLNEVMNEVLNECVANESFDGYFDFLHEHFLFGIFIDSALIDIENESL